ncbi:hypothetical protein Tco_0835507 [Tanacetum coccineum]
MGATACAPRAALHNVMEKKKKKHGSVCEENGYKFIPFAFSTFGEFDTDALDTLSRIKSISISHSNNAKSGVFIFHRVSFCIQKGVGAQLVSRLPSNFIGDMLVVRFHCPFVSLSGCQDGGRNGLTKTLLITHLLDRHCSGEAQAITKHSLLTDLAVFERTELTLKRMGLWLCGPHVPSYSKQSDHVNNGVYDLHGGFTLSLLDIMFSKGLRIVKSILQVSFGVFSGDILSACLLLSVNTRKSVLLMVIRSWGMLGGSLQLLKETLAESSLVVSDDDDLDLGERILNSVRGRFVMDMILQQLEFFCNTPKNVSQQKYVRGRYFIIHQHKIQENDL